MQNGGTDAIGADVTRVDPAVPKEDVLRVRELLFFNILRIHYISYNKII